MKFQNRISHLFLAGSDLQGREKEVLEFADGKPIVNSPTSESELTEFFELREEYKKNCVVNS